MACNFGLYTQWDPNIICIKNMVQDGNFFLYVGALYNKMTRPSVYGHPEQTVLHSLDRSERTHIKRNGEPFYCLT